MVSTPSQQLTALFVDHYREIVEHLLEQPQNGHRLQRLRLTFKFASTHIAHYPAQESWGRETRNHAFGLMSDARTITFDYAAFAIVESRELLVAEVEVLYF